MAKKAKKRGVKPGTKRSPYRKSAPVNIVGNFPSLMTELQATISQLEGQLTAQIDRIKSILT